jgi:hypothetical protein
MNNGGSYGIVCRQVGQYSNQALCKHGLASARWTNEQHVMRAGRGNFACMSRRALSAHISHVGNVVLHVFNVYVGHLLPLLFPANATNQLGKIGHGTNSAPRSNASLTFSNSGNYHHSIIE